MKATRTQAQRRAESERRLLQAAVELVGEKGFTQTTIEDVGLRAGYSRGLVSNRYGSKLGLAKAVFAYNRKEIGRHMSAQSAGVEGNYRILLQVCAGYFRAVAKSSSEIRALYVMMFETLGPLSDLKPDYEELTQGLIGLFEAMLIRARKSGEISREFKPRDIAFSIVAQLRGVTLHWLGNEDQVDLATSFDELVFYLNARLQPLDHAR